MTFRASVLTLYPDMFPGPLGASLGNSLRPCLQAASGVDALLRRCMGHAGLWAGTAGTGRA